jgi:energy-coupling factor transporter ATP-binding protein EcfA2
MVKLVTRRIHALRRIRKVSFPDNVKFRQLLVTGPPGAGKTTLINRIHGWPEEGYLDLSQPKWWNSPVLAMRPREVHLGLPFVGLDQACTVYDKEWITANPYPLVDLERIHLPSKKRFFFSRDRRKSYVFEFLLPPASLILARRRERAKQCSHPVDADLSFQLVRAQIDVFRQVALYLHQNGLRVYIRRNIDADPRRILALEEGGHEITHIDS